MIVATEHPCSRTTLNLHQDNNGGHTVTLSIRSNDGTQTGPWTQLNVQLTTEEADELGVALTALFCLARDREKSNAALRGDATTG